ncbi:hypothetical protein J437_LFUL017242 [Ladona fulva]|uniref:Uncharacterized protein n=1 Tax=Ladona fulva TaxID=123851 RepID=A0A8K0KQ38_LADFU|nr:hypothetical protein J437_LFUL017242 [Ladona fulva]
MEEDTELSAEEFFDTTREKIILALSNSQDAMKYKWAVNFLQRAARGFGDVYHEPWIGPLSLKECSEVLLQTYKKLIRNSDLDYAYLNSMLQAVTLSSLNVNDFISELVTVLVDENELTCENITIDTFPQEKRIEQESEESQSRDLLVSVGTNARVGNCSYGNSLKRLPLRTKMETSDEISCMKKSSRLCKDGKESSNEVKDLLNNIWIWVKNNRVQLSPEIMGKLLSSLPERVEEVMIDISLEVIKNSISRKKLVSDVEKEFEGNSSWTSINNEAYIVDSVFQDNVLIIGAATTSPKLFQICSSVLNQLLIQSSGCSDAWSAMLTLCSSFARETAQKRAAFYPLEVQSAVIWMDVEPGKIKSKEYQEKVQSHLRNTLKNLPTEMAIALFSHFPEWLPHADLMSLLHYHR